MSKTEIREYKEKHSFQERYEKGLSMLRESPDKIPVILLKSKVSKYTLPAHR